MFERIKEALSGAVDKVKTAIKGERISRSFVKEIVKYWNRQKFGTSKYGYPTKPKQASLKKVNTNKKPTVRALRPVRSRTDKNFITIVEVRGRDKKTNKSKKFTVAVGHDERLTVKELKKRAEKQAGRLARNPDIPDEYDISVREIVPLISYFNVEGRDVQQYRDVIDELNPAYFD